METSDRASAQRVDDSGSWPLGGREREGGWRLLSDPLVCARERDQSCCKPGRREGNESINSQARRSGQAEVASTTGENDGSQLLYR
jgi:hypothetical protein